MKFKEIERKVEQLRSSMPMKLSQLHLTILACYANSYAQKEEIIIEDHIGGVDLEGFRNYGIISTEVTYGSSFYKRIYLLFIDDPASVENFEAFDAFSEEYSKKYLPEGVIPDTYAIKFEVNDFETVQHCMDIVKQKYPNIVQLYSFSNLTKAARYKTMLDTNLESVGKSYNVFILTHEIFREEIVDFRLSSEFLDEDSISLFYERLNRVAQTRLKGKTLIINDCPENDEVFSTYLALALAYFTFRYKIPVLVDALIQDTYTAALRLFYCSFDIYTAYDKIIYLQKYPKLCYSNRSILDYLVYIQPEDRKLIGKVEYLKDSKVIVNEVDLYSTKIYPSLEEPSYVPDLIALEKKSPSQRFFHMGNCLYMDIEGEKRLVHCVEFLPEFRAIISSCDRTVPPFTKILQLNQLIHMFPCGALHYHRDERGNSLLHDFVRFLGQLANQGKIAPPNIRDGMNCYLPSYAESGLGPIVYELTRIRGDQFKFKNLDPALMNIYGYYNVKMRNEIVDSIIKIVPLYNLRKFGSYLTPYGATSSLLLKSDLFRTVPLDD